MVDSRKKFLLCTVLSVFALVLSSCGFAGKKVEEQPQYWRSQVALYETAISEKEEEIRRLLTNMDMQIEKINSTTGLSMSVMAIEIENLLRMSRDLDKGKVELYKNFNLLNSARTELELAGK